MVGNTIRKKGKDHWFWFQKGIGKSYYNESEMIGMSPFGVIAFSREALDYLSLEEWDGDFDLKIQAELRTPTILKKGNFKFQEMRNKNIFSQPLKAHLKDRTISHPIKNERDILP